MREARIALVVGLLSISIYPVLVKWAPVSGLTSAFYRMAIAVLLLAPYVWIRKELVVPPMRLWLPIALCGLIFASDIAIWNLSIQYSNATQATLLTNLSPVWVGIASHFLNIKRPGPRFWIGTIIALSGLLILIGFDTISEMKFNKGFYYAIISGLLYASYMLVSKKVLSQFKVVPFMFYSMAVSSIYLWFICFFSGQQLWYFSANIWIVFVVQGVICQLLGWFSLSFAIKKMDAGSVSLFLLLQSVVTGLMAWLFIGEKIQLQTLIGGLVILFGIATTFIGKRKKIRLQESKSQEDIL